MDFTLMWESLPKILDGTYETMRLVVLSLAVGLVGSVIVALMRLSRSAIVSGLAYGYVYVFRGTPLFVQIYLIYYGLGQYPDFWESIGLWVVLREPFWCAIIALAMNTTAYTSEIIRGGILSVPNGQLEAAKACGMSPLTIFRRITLPVAIRQGLPAYGNEVVLMVKATSLASTITLMEMTGIANQIISRTYAVLEVFLVAGAIYLGINFLATRLIRALEWKLTPYLRPRPTS